MSGLSRTERHRGLIATTEVRLRLLGDPTPGEPPAKAARRRALLAELDDLTAGDVTRVVEDRKPYADH